MRLNRALVGALLTLLIPNPINRYFRRASISVDPADIPAESIALTHIDPDLIYDMDAKSSPVATDQTAIADSEDDNDLKKVTLANMAAFYGAIAQMVADLKSSLFLTFAEFDAGTTGAVDTKLSDALEAKGQLIGAIGIVTELWNGTADSTVKLSKAAAGATLIASTVDMDKDSTQALGSVVGFWPVTGANSIVASGGDAYAYVATDASRSTGKLCLILIWMKTA
jgi:hypothetical protein